MKIPTNFGGNFRSQKSGLFPRYIVYGYGGNKIHTMAVKKIKKPPNPF